MKKNDAEKEVVEWPSVPLRPMVPVPWPPTSIVSVGVVGIILAYVMVPLAYQPIRVLVGALIWDSFLGQIPLIIHPVVLVGRLISKFQSITPKEIYSQPVKGFLFGLALLISTITITVSSAWLYLFITRTVTTNIGIFFPTLRNLSSFIQYLFEVVLCKTTMSLELLCRVALQMSFYLERDQIDRGRIQLCWLCSRDASNLRSDELAGGSIESVAENLSDGLVSSLFWYVFVCVTYDPHYALLGAVFFKASNTLDSRVGHRGKYEYYGKASARFDDVLNLASARITALLLAIAALFVPGFGFRSCSHGLSTAWTDASQCDSPNAGWPMAVMAGVLGVKLEKRGQYCLGARSEPPGANDIRKGVVIAKIAGLLSAILSIGVIYKAL